MSGPEIAAAMTIGFNIFKDLFLYLKSQHEYTEELDRFFESLEMEVNALRSQRIDKEKEVESNQIMKEKTNHLETWLSQTKEIESKFGNLKTRYQKARKSKKDVENLRKSEGARKFKEEVENAQNKSQNTPKSEEIESLESRKQDADKSGGEIENLRTRNQNAGNSEEVNAHKYLGSVQRFFKLEKVRRFFKLAKLAEEIVKQREEVVRIHDRLKLGDLMTDKKPETFETKHANKIDDVPSLNKHVEDLLKHLRDEDLKRIGIWGPPGVGKTTILENLKNTLENLNDQYEQFSCSSGHTVFGIVIWANDEGEDSVWKIQQELAKKLNIRVQDANNNGLAGIISRALDKRKYLLILDKVSSEIKLNEVGIHDSHKYGKVVIASRIESVCKKMSMQELIHVKRLSNDDAWNLFEKNVGDVVVRPRIKEIAERIVMELGGLPQAIKSVALSLKDEYIEPIWYNTLWTLQSYDGSDEQLDLAGVPNAFILVYNQLLDYQKKCLLYGALYPKDYKIFKDYLIECWRAERFIPDIQQDGAVGNRQIFRLTRDKGDGILKELTGRCLLEWCSRKEYVTMPVIFRRLALRSLYPQEGCRVLVKAGVGINEHPAEEECKDAKMISLMCNKLQSLPESPNCCDISRLLLQRNEKLRTIPNSFFAYMCGLRVLNLYHTRIESLPLSIFNLSNLKGLYLNKCRHLVTLSTEIGNLEDLEVLDIRDTGLHSLPIEIGHLVGLRCLRASFINDADSPLNEIDANVGNQSKRHSRVIIPPDVVNKLCNLEELTIIVDHQEPSWKDTANEIAKDVASLKALTTLAFYFPNVSSLETFIEDSESWNNESTPWEKNTFRSFKIQVGCHETRHHRNCSDSLGSSAKRHLRFSAGEDKGISPVIGKVLKKASAFELIGHRNVQKLSDFGMENMISLDVCLTLNGCPMLSEILSAGMIHTLTQLQHLKVKNCSRIGRIIEAHEQDGEITEVVNISGALPNLKILELVNLPELISICQDDSLDWQSLEEIKIRECGKLRDLSLSTTNAGQLRSIKCDEVSWRALKQQEDGVKRRLRHICRSFNGEPLSAYGTTPEANEPSDNGDTNHQLPHLNGLANHNEEHLKSPHASNSMPADAGPASDPSSSSNCLPLFLKKR